MLSTMRAIPAEQPVRCSAWARSVELDPVGTVGTYRGFALVDVPLPWPHDVAELPALSSLASYLAERNIRLQATVPTGVVRSVVLYTRPTEGPFCGYVRRSAPLGQDPMATVSVLMGEPGTGTGAQQVLVCTHGKRDICCGSSGMQLVRALEDVDLPGKASVARTSHMGGHRFAPNFLVLPEGTAWAFASVDLVFQVLTRTGNIDEIARHYRGCTGLGPSAVQALEREVLRSVGWSLLSRPRWGWIVSSDAEEQLVRLQVDAMGHQPASVWEGVVSSGRSVLVPDCGGFVSDAQKSETELRVDSLSQVA